MENYLMGRTVRTAILAGAAWILAGCAPTVLVKSTLSPLARHRNNVAGVTM